MKEYIVEIREYYSKAVKIKAEDAVSARQQVQEDHANQKIILDSDNFVTVEFGVWGEPNETND